MKKFTFLFLMIFVIVNTQAQNYKISFKGTGASFKVDSVKVENLTQCKSLFLNGSDTLNLRLSTGVNELGIRNEELGIKVYPNPMTGYCLIEFDAIAQGETTLSLYDIAGKRITQSQELLMRGQHEFSLSGIGSGIYILKVESNAYSYSAKIASTNLSSGTAELKQIEAASNQSTVHSPQSTENNSLNGGIKKSLNSNKSSKDMQYKAGDTLKLTGFSDMYSTVLIQVPVKNQTDTFNFILCTDGDNNNYTIVQIGTQIWMEENLKTTKYNDGTSIPLVTDNTEWAKCTTPAYCWYNDSVKYKNIYGALYNWYAVNTGKLCPSGWYVPDTVRWYKLLNYLGGANVAGGKMKETCSMHWKTPNVGATNNSGFTALPGGSRFLPGGTFNSLGFLSYWWSATDYFTIYASYLHLYFNNPKGTMNYVGQGFGNSVRCIKDCPTIDAPNPGTNFPSQNQIGWNWHFVNEAGGYKWNTTNNYNTATDNGLSTSYTQQGLKCDTSYTLYVWAYNNCGNHSNVATLTQSTLSCPFICGTSSITDIDSNSYNTVQIGTQCWMQQNLRTTKYNDGDTVPNISDNITWGHLSTPGYCWYNNDAVYNKSTYGALYNWFVVNTGKLCPAGWHVPTHDEWTTLERAVCSSSSCATDFPYDTTSISFRGTDEGGKLKEAGTALWESPNAGATNSSGFTALPGGYRDYGDGTFYYITYDGFWWSASELNSGLAWYRVLDNNNSGVYRNYDYRKAGYSVRCVRN